MSEAVVFLAAPLAMCLVLAGIHCYLGLHVLARGVVFVDLSLAQVAMLGAAASVLLGYDHHSSMAYAFSLAFNLTFALIFATVRRFEPKVSEEALIGITYAFASGCIILVLDRTPHGMEELKEALVGQMLWVTWLDVAKTAAIYSVVGLIHYVYRRSIWMSSLGAGSWTADLLFYGLFGVVITSSTHVAGVLLVFSLLIVPAVLAKHFFDSIRRQLVFGWIFGGVMCVIGVAMSYYWDFPVGAFIVVVFTAVPILFFLGRAILGALAMARRTR